ncbi:hypothetical protein JDV02_003223 [Purpureocillium takamizusanense]|uniref:Argonaute complex, subunit Arb1 n=1 Tax=Purpureocillium takamizusanense TaxID=2060973 RepID=A0A9Q8QA77_9HYPO|nr:uncharacterized protein JDV02_003223 [Purpureocillium takamizusanense]UNI16824.1 hypothetical protein JDV02_003223 [Purpureocillium takamizusanense]
MDQSKDSETVAEVVAGGSTVTIGGIEHPSEIGVSNQPDSDGDVLLGAGDEQTQASKSSKKKRRNRGKKSLAQRGPTALPKNRGTGFEEYYADPPMTPQEHADEQTEVYSSDIPFADRIQSCIQRFRTRRRLQSEHTLFFDEYLFLGGVDTSMNQFGGHDPKDLQGLTPAERRDLTARDTVHGGSSGDDRFYNGDEEDWSVDFTGVAAGFFSTPLMELTGGKIERMAAAADVVANFLRYVLQHDVCPEYEDDVKRALQLCSDAKDEWPAVDAVRSSVPGAFNLAAADLFSPADPGDWTIPIHSRPENFDPKAIFYASCALLGLVEVFDLIEFRQPVPIKETRCAVEVTRIERATADIIERFKQLKIGDGEPGLAPIGRVCVRPTSIEDGWDHPSGPAPVDSDNMWLFFEDAILANMREGMKMAVVIIELEVGFRFVKACSNVVPTFYTFLPQELMKHYKMPRVNERPAPSVHDRFGDEAQHYQED